MLLGMTSFLRQFFLLGLFAFLMLAQEQKVYALPLSYQPFELKQFYPNAIQKNLIESSGVVEHSILANDGSLWLLTKAALWRWYPLTGVVQKISTGSEFSLAGTNRSMGASGDGIFVAVDGQVWRFGTSTGNMDHLAGSWAASCKNGRFFGEDEFFVARNDCGAWFVDIKAKKLRAIPTSTRHGSWASATLVPSCQCLWVSDGRQLKKLVKSDASMRTADIYDAKAPILGAASLPEHVIAWTPHALLVFDSQTLKRVQVVPTSGQRRIVSAAFLPELHVVLFHDGTIEWLAPKTKRAWTSRIEPMAGSRIELDPAAAFALVHTPGFLPMAINLEGLKL